MKPFTKRRLLSVLLSAVMLVSLLPVQVFAEDEPAPGQPEASAAVCLTKLSAAPADGDEVLIFYPKDSMALTATASGAKLSGVNAEPAEGLIQKTDDMAMLTVGVSEDVYTFALSDGKYLTSKEAGNGVSFDETLSDLGRWTLEAQEDGTWYLMNVGAEYNGNHNQALEYYNGFTTYGVKANNAAYKFDFYAELAAEPVSGLYDGQTVAIYNDGNAKALTATAAKDNKSNDVLAATDATLSGDKVTGEDIAVFTVGVEEDGCVTFEQDGKYLTSGATGSSLTLAEEKSNLSLWLIEEAGDGLFFLKNKEAAYNGGAQYLEYYGGNFTTYGKKETAAPKPYAMSFRAVGEAAEEEPGTESLLEEGAAYVIYNAKAEGSFGIDNSGLGTSLANVPTEIEDGEAYPDNGAYIFTVGVEGDYYTFRTGDGYLTSDDSEALYLQEELTEYGKWSLTARDEGYILYNKSAKYNGTPVCVEFFSGAFSGWTFKSSDAAIFVMQFLPLAAVVKTLNGTVNNPGVVFDGDETVPKQADYEGGFTLDDLTPAEQIASVTLTCNGEPVETENDGKAYTFAIPADSIGEAEELILSVTVVYTEELGSYSGQKTVSVLDVPMFVSVSPAANSQTGEDKQPEIVAELRNAADATVEMSINGEPVEAAISNGRVSYKPAEPLSDGRTTVSVTVTRADGETASRTWSFTVGEATERLYFGQLHSHTTYSDGAGTLEAALDYIGSLKESDNIHFVAFTDHSNYFDTTSAANQEDALYDMSVASADSQRIWKEYKDTAAAFNARQSDVVALAGFEMTWSGGPGHINTWATPGIVSRNNTTLNNKTADAGMKAYYALLSRPEGKDSISQFNHPGKTFGTFSDFSYWDPVTDSRIYTVEVGNGEGPIGQGGYYPSYEQYTTALDKGWHLAPTNNQDNHKGRWGNANDARDVILTDDFSEEGLYAAMREMKIYATEDKNLELYYTVNDQPLGSSITEVPEMLNLNVQVSDPDKTDSISKVEVIVNSGKVAYTWDDPAQLAGGTLTAELEPKNSYYYIRVTEADGDLAVTAPVWVGETLLLGVSAFECGTAMPVTNEELTLTTTLFNSEASAATVKSIVYTTNGSQVLYADTTGYTIQPSGTLPVTFNYVPTLGRLMTITVTVVMELNGEEYTYSKDITLDVQDADSLVYVGIDASHYNEYVAGNYKDSMGNFGGLASGYGVRTVELKTSEQLIAACENSDGKFAAIIFTAPSRRLSAAQSDPRFYSAAELEAIAAFNKAGGAVIVSGWSDYYENYSVITGNPNVKHMAATQNELLAALGSSLRVADDATYDESLNGGQVVRLYFSTYNMDNPLMEGIVVDPAHPNDRAYSEVFSHYGGASIYAVNADGAPVSSLPDTVSPAVYGHASTFSADSDGDGLGGETVPRYAVADGDTRLLITATEQIGGQGMILVSGAAFMSNFEVQASISNGASDADTQKNYSNYKFCENLVGSLHQAEVTPISDVQAQTEEGFKYTIEGVVTSNASGYDKDTAFFDCIYVQDETGGVCCFPVAGDFRIGDKVRVSGYTDFYQGEAELQVQSIVKLGDGTAAQPKKVSAAQINDRSVQGQLVSLSGTVVSSEESNGLVQTIMVKDAAGGVARVFIDGYITTGNEVKNLADGCKITAVGLASYDDTFNAPEGPFPRIRVRDRADIVCTAADSGAAELALTPVASGAIGSMTMRLDLTARLDLGAAVIALECGEGMTLIGVEGVEWTSGDLNIVINEDIPAGTVKTVLLTFSAVHRADRTVTAQLRASAAMDETEYGPGNAVSAKGFLVGDANGDGVIGLGDLVRLRRYIGTNGEGLTMNPGGDLNGDGAYDGLDLTALHRYFATTRI